MSKLIQYSLGLDPGWRNLGIGLVRREDDKLFAAYSATINPSLFNDSIRIGAILQPVYNRLDANANELSYATIERYVSYQGVNTAEAENILMLIGGLRENLQQRSNPQSNPCDIILTRAIEWKIELVQLLHTHKGFSNPSDKLDKKFSIAAAECCLDLPKGEIKSDHEADALAIAALPLLRGIYKSKRN